MFLSRSTRGYWYLYYRDECSKHIKVSTKAKVKSEANAFLRNFKQQQKQSPLAVESLSKLCEIVCESLMRTHTPKTIRSLKTTFNELIRILGDLNPSLTTNRQIDYFITVKIKDASQWTGLKYLRAISSVFNHAARMGYDVANPCKNVLPPRPPRQLPLYMSQGDAETFLAAITNIPFRRICTFALSTGMRLGELVQLRWDHVNLEARTLTVQNTDTFTTKNKRNRTIPLSDTALRVLHEIKSRQQQNKFVFLNLKGFPWSESNIGHPFRRYIKKSGLNPRYHFHTLRHTFASWLVQKGVNIYEVKELLGHSNITTTQIYVHLQPETLHSTVNKISIPLN
jgi:site-specific recombinase XerD